MKWIVFGAVVFGVCLLVCLSRARAAGSAEKLGEMIDKKAAKEE